MRKTQKINIIGNRFGNLVVLSEVAERNKNGHILYTCECDCGNKKNILGSSLRQKLTTSCGCVHKKKITKHGMDGTKVYRTWVGMRNRCNNPNNRRFHDYGGRGISVCNEWNNSFDAFYLDMGEPKPNQSIERIDNSKPYCKENCVWATNKQQCNNRRSSVVVYFDGIEMTVEEYSKKVGLSVSGARKKVIREFIRFGNVFIKESDPAYQDALDNIEANKRMTTQKRISVNIEDL